jgi:hypothetical protein
MGGNVATVKSTTENTTEGDEVGDVMGPNLPQRLIPVTVVHFLS